MKNFGDYPYGESVFCFFTTSDASGAAMGWDSTPTVSVYSADNLTQVDATNPAVDLTEDFDSVTGLHLIEISTDGDAFFVRENVYTIIVSGNIDSTAVVSIVGQFTIEARWPYLADLSFDDVPDPDPDTWNMMYKLLWLVSRFMNKHTSDNFNGIKVFKKDGTLATTQAVTEAGGVKTVGKAQ